MTLPKRVSDVSLLTRFLRFCLTPLSSILYKPEAPASGLQVPDRSLAGASGLYNVIGPEVVTLQKALASNQNVAQYPSLTFRGCEFIVNHSSMAL